MNISMTDGTVTLSEGNLAQTLTNSKGEKVSQIKGSCKSIPIEIDITPKEGYIIEFFRQNSTTLLENAEAQTNYKIYPSKGDNFFVKFKKKKTTYTWVTGYVGTGTILTEPDWLVNNADGSQDIRTGNNNAGASMQQVLKEPFEMTAYINDTLGFLIGFLREDGKFIATWHREYPFPQFVSYSDDLVFRPWGMDSAYEVPNPVEIGIRVLIDGTIEAKLVRTDSRNGEWVEISNFKYPEFGATTGSPQNYTKKSPLTTSYRPFIAWSNDYNGTIWYENFKITSLKP